MIYETVKRALDIAVSCVVLLISSPLLVLIGIAIKREDGGKILYASRRVGLSGRPFSMYKFRSMVVDAERIGGSSTSDGDPRITWIGKILRKTKLDELPQFWNVLKGDMSLVGPRPEVEEYTNLYTEDERVLLDIKPGITDFATLWNPDEGALLAGEADPDRAYLEKIRPEKIRQQLRYARERGFWTDFAILTLTVAVVLRRLLRIG